MEMTQEPGRQASGEIRFGALAWARRLLWMQVAVLGVLWLLPNAWVAAVVVTDGVPHDESAGWLLVPVIYSAPLLLLTVPGAVLAARCRPGRRGVHIQIMVGEAVLLTACALSLVLPQLRMALMMLVAMPPVLVVEALCGIAVLAILLRAHTLRTGDYLAERN
ncbi:hypothetical protein [Actinomadura verrucosospora]|uniref:Uncharacterized protein n=1 Tax=Actinomadura verrucosospora TaxID=46165 RepID=A0A7D4ABX1_ACTVE|nr:hypothetical protein [Actinomadura verrucosospora]QKG27245.1 hypothetical protein ACTIVE_8898 [Actinomadura verrucosospora]